eukprot:Gregarina_sp_Poly_1__354@NODE_1086_length_5140_cov_448_935344_g288_i1_p1_GENE_NODE_1086_length_5140_cov_448_935344_g288_i1NODE_1086_length_5140_cov_448_935344_g288_i1_p1_ORF_typecomplete_len468_score36_96_NODE_1086_length_5140_cov_448_935344_g288_i11841587
MSSSVLSQLFPSYTLESQILPNGFHVVDSVHSNAPPSLARPMLKKLPFSPTKALRDPTTYAKASRAEGYARLVLNVTRGVAEMYRHEEVEASVTASPPAHGGEKGGSPCCNGASPSPGNIEGPPMGSTPPFFPQFRVFLNDKAVYQTRVVNLHKATVDPRSSAVSSVPHNADQQFPSSVSALSDQSMKLIDVYDLEWNEESTYWIYSPATILTIQLIELDFCPDLQNSEDLLTSISIPLAPLTLNKPLDLILNVLCTLPHSYSLESLVSESERVIMALHADASPPLPVQGPRLTVCPPTAIVCKIHVSLTLEQLRRNHTRAFTEIAALALPRGPWTPNVLVQEVQAKDQLILLCGTELLGSSSPTSVSVSYVFKQLGSLVFSLTRGFDAIGCDQVVTLLGHNSLHYSLDDRKKLTYVAAGEDLAAVYEHLIIGPFQGLSSFLHELMHFQRPLILVVIFSVLCRIGLN